MRSWRKERKDSADKNTACAKDLGQRAEPERWPLLLQWAEDESTMYSEIDGWVETDEVIPYRS